MWTDEKGYVDCVHYIGRAEAREVGEIYLVKS